MKWGAGQNTEAQIAALEGGQFRKWGRGDDQFADLMEEMPADRRTRFKESMFRSLAAPTSTNNLPAQMQDALGRVTKATTAGITTNTGLNAYNLESPALEVWPNIALLRNRIPRKPMGGTGFRYRQITDIDRGNFSYGLVAPATTMTPASNDGRLTTLISTTVSSDIQFDWQLYGAENAISWAEQFASAGFSENFGADELMRASTLLAALQREEALIIGGNATATGPVLNTSVTKTGVTQAAAGTGSLTASTSYDFRISCLTYLGWRRGATGRAGSTDAIGESTASTVVTLATTASGAGSDSIAFKWTDIPRALAYNIYGVATGGTPLYLCTVFAPIVQINTVATTSTNVVNTADLTDDANGVDGLLPQILTGSTSYKKLMNGSSLSADSAGGVRQLSDMFADRMATRYMGLGDGAMAWFSPSLQNSIDAVTVGSATPPTFQYRVEPGEPTGIVLGNRAIAQRNQVDAGRPLNFGQHPDVPPGIMFGWAENLGQWYPRLRLPSTVEIGLGRETTSFEFAQTGLFYPAAVYTYGAPVLRVVFASWVVKGIGPVTVYTG